MSNLVTSNAIESALIQGDLKLLKPEERLSYYKNVCESLGLNPLTKPFEYISLNGKLVLYARRDATDQLRKNQKVSITIKAREVINDIYVVTANGKDKDGREDESTGAVNIQGLKGDNLANAYMKAETKAKRRVTLSLCGLGILDETEIETIEDAKEPVKNVFESEKEQIEQLAHDPGSYIPNFGKYAVAGSAIKDINVHELNNYVEWLKKGYETSKKPWQLNHKEFVEMADAYLLTREPGFTPDDRIPF